RKKESHSETQKGFWEAARGKPDTEYLCKSTILATNVYANEHNRASKEWGDATRGLQFTTATRAILALGRKPIHTKNWRPQLLVYVPVGDDLVVKGTALLHLVRQLKAGKGTHLPSSFMTMFDVVMLFVFVP
ncbi:unnamed protein product, partial [Dibothriocephalus latus]